jgi:hypothetical protein
VVMIEDTYSGAPDECSKHFPKKPSECGCEPHPSSFMLQGTREDPDYNHPQFDTVEEDRGER